MSGRHFERLLWKHEEKIFPSNNVKNKETETSDSSKKSRCAI